MSTLIAVLAALTLAADAKPADNATTPTPKLMGRPGEGAPGGAPAKASEKAPAPAAEPAPAPKPEGTTPTPKLLNDAQIATVALTAHQIDIERGKMAQKKTKNGDVKQFADQMVTDHGTGLKEVQALAKKLKVKPEESDVTKQLKAEAADKKLLLSKLSGADFDKAYIDAEVAYHQGVVDALDKVLIPGAKNEELKKALENTRPTIAGHLQHAQNVQKLLAGGGK
jgi:putative membrane protein